MNDRSNTPRQVIKSREDVFVFGKHKGHTVQIVLDEDPGYIVWLDEEEILVFPDDIYQKAQQLDAEHGYYPECDSLFLNDGPPY